jgi:hypothetical protein
MSPGALESGTIIRPVGVRVNVKEFSSGVSLAVHDLYQDGETMFGKALLPRVDRTLRNPSTDPSLCC